MASMRNDKAARDATLAGAKSLRLCAEKLRYFVSKIGGVQPDFADPMRYAQLQKVLVDTCNGVASLLDTLASNQEQLADGNLDSRRSDSDWTSADSD